ncbi:MAG: DUF3750 domain-containing protein [bacterium]
MLPNAEKRKSLIDPNKFQVFLCTCPAAIPVQFVRHPWFVVNMKGVVHRYEVRHAQTLSGVHSGFLYTDCLLPFQGTEMSLWTDDRFWDVAVRVEGVIEGDNGSLAESIARYIETTPTTYPFRDEYFATGPNSNTYAEWILKQFPAWSISLPWNSLGKQFAHKKYPVGLVHGRFQPPHVGHIAYILRALERAEHVMIGICTPEICTEADAARTGYPCAPHQNPLTNDERVDMLTLALEAEGVDRTRYSFIAFPSDYKNSKALLPKGTIFLMSVTGPSDTKKIDYLKKIGFRAEVVITIPESSDRARSGLVRENAHNGDQWKTVLPPAIIKYIEDHDILSRLR